MNFLFRHIFFLSAWLMVMSGGIGAVCGQTKTRIDWKQCETKYVILHFQSDDDLKKFGRKIDYYSGPFRFSRLFSGLESDRNNIRLISKVDAVYERVQEILDVRQRTKKLSIRIYADKEQLNRVFHQMRTTAFKGFNGYPRVRAWYIHQHNTIYLNAEDFHEGILAHEIAHSIIDHCLVVRPPRAMAEILARHVEMNLY